MAYHCDLGQQLINIGPEKLWIGSYEALVLAKTLQLVQDGGNIHGFLPPTPFHPCSVAPPTLRSSFSGREVRSISYYACSELYPHTCESSFTSWDVLSSGVLTSILA